MESKKGLLFTIIVNALSTLASLFYIALIAAYIYETWWTLQQDGEGFGFLFLFLLFGSPILLIWALIPIIRFIMIIFPTIALIRCKREKSPKVFKIITFVFQMMELAFTLFMSGMTLMIAFLAFEETWHYLTKLTVLEKFPGYLVITAVVVLAYLAKYALQIISIILLIDYKSLKADRSVRVAKKEI